MNDDINDNVRKARADYVEGALRGLIASGEDLVGEAQRRAPLEEGTLKASATLVLIVNGNRYDGAGGSSAAISAARSAALAGREVTCDAEISFNTVYAARQHEELSWRHPLAGEAKYLERPLLERSGRYQSIISSSAQRGTI